MKEFFIEKRFAGDALALIETCNTILDEYEADGYDLSLRQLYYQLVARGIVLNTEQSYKRVGSIVSDARLAGLMDWDMIKDRGRSTEENGHWDHPGDIVSAAARSFRLDLWDTQPYRVEVMVEKQALEGVLIPVCQSLDVAFTANKGYSSSSAMYEAGKRLAEHHAKGSNVLVIYLGDHDPSGIDMTRDVEERLNLFAGTGGDIEVQRVALNMDQIKKLKPPENPAKMTDSRADSYVKKFGMSSWELDAIEPRALATLVENAVLAVRDEAKWKEALARQKTMRTALEKVAKELEAKYA